jgi:hypothetical protein
MFSPSPNSPRSRAVPQQSAAVWRVSPLAWLLILPAIAAEAFSNGLRAYALGAHLHHFSLSIQGHPVSLSGAVLVLAAVAEVTPVI